MYLKAAVGLEYSFTFFYILNYGQPGVIVFEREDAALITRSTVYVESSWFGDYTAYASDYKKHCTSVSELSGIGKFLLEIVGDD